MAVARAGPHAGSQLPFLGPHGLHRSQGLHGLHEAHRAVLVFGCWVGKCEAGMRTRPWCPAARSQASCGQAQPRIPGTTSQTPSDTKPGTEEATVSALLGGEGRGAPEKAQVEMHPAVKPASPQLCPGHLFWQPAPHVHSGQVCTAHSQGPPASERKALGKSGHQALQPGILGVQGWSRTCQRQCA